MQVGYLLITCQFFRQCNWLLSNYNTPVGLCFEQERMPKFMMPYLERKVK